MPHNFFLLGNELLNSWLVHMELLVVAFGYRTRNDQWSSRIVDQNRVNLIHHGEVMLALYHLFGSMHHVIAEVVEAEFIVCSISDICEVCLPSFVGVRLMFVDTIYLEAEPFENGAIPFLVTTSEVIVYRYNMYAFSW